LLVSALIIAPLVALLILDYRHNFGAPGIWLAALPLLFTVLGVAEVLDLLAAKNLRPVAWSVYAGSALVTAASLVPIFGRLVGTSDLPPNPLVQLAWPLGAFVVAIALVFIAEMARYQGPGGVIVNIALAVFTVAYVAVLMTFLIALRVYHDNGWGMAALVSVIFVTKMSDTGAYACGRLFGRHKMAPILSPKKTIEGGIGGLVTACLCSWLFFTTLLPVLAGPQAQVPPLRACLVYGLVVGVAGVIGDLSESLLKRDMQRKDSSRWIPGLGGILDVFDSLLLAAPAGYFCWISGVLGP